MQQQQLRNIIDNTLVPHTAFQMASSRLEQCFMSADGASEPISIAIVGESRTGKTRALEEFSVAHPAQRQNDGLCVPILRAKAPSQPTVKGLVEVMLRALKDPRADKGTEQARTARLMELVKGAQTRAVMIDEFQHFYDKGTHRVIHHVADWLKTFVDDAKVVLIVAGLPTCMSVITQNEQLAGRFLSPIRMPRFDWTDDEEREEFIAILAAFNEALSRHFEVPRLDTEEMGFRFYCGTGGLMGYLTKLLRCAVWNAVDAKREKIALRNLDEAHMQSVWDKKGLSSIPRPFGREFSTAPTEELLRIVSSIGTATQPAPTRRGRRASQPVEGASSALGKRRQKN